MNEWVIINPVESMSVNIWLVPVNKINEEIIFSNNIVLILSVDFCRVV
jgi:hypothetical protein